MLNFNACLGSRISSFFFFFSYCELYLRNVRNIFSDREIFFPRSVDTAVAVANVWCPARRGPVKSRWNSPVYIHHQ